MIQIVGGRMNQHLQTAVVLKSHSDFIEMANLINPEPHLNDFLNQTIRPIYKEAYITKKINFRTFSPKTKQTYLASIYDPTTPLAEILDLDQCDLQGYLHSKVKQPTLHCAISITNVTWITKVWSIKNRHVPHYAPKTLYYGISATLTTNNLTTWIEDVNRTLWYNFQSNITTVVPVTATNFLSVLSFHWQTLSSKIQ